MDRRNFVRLLCAGVLGTSKAALAQAVSKIRRIGILHTLARTEPLPQAFLRGLGEIGYVDGQTVIIEYRNGAPGDLPALAEELVSLKVDLIYAISVHAALAASHATKSIPIVFAVVGDPVRAGLVASLGRPSGNVTGISEIGSDLGGKRLELLKELIPSLSRIGVLWNPNLPDNVFESTPMGKPAQAPDLEQIEAAGRALGIQVHSFAVRAPGDLTHALDAATRERVAALIVVEDPLTYLQKMRIIEFTAANRLPAIYGFREYVVSGGLISYGPDLPYLMRRATGYIDKILKGAKPSDLPVEQPTKFELAINLKTAKMLGLAIPQPVLLRADDLIE